jgi:hypothetical protein
MAADSTEEYRPSYREETVDETLDEHDVRISRNEKRWLMTKGALGMLATVKGVDFAISQLGSFI